MSRKTTVCCFAPGVPNSPAAADWPTFEMHTPAYWSNRRARVLFKRLFQREYGVQPRYVRLFQTTEAGAV